MAGFGFWGLYKNWHVAQPNVIDETLERRFADFARPKMFVPVLPAS
jgi:hypothetical protein